MPKERISVEERFGPYKKPTAETIPKFEEIQRRALDLAVYIDELCPDSPEKFTALTQLQLCKMSANAAIAIYTK